MPEIQLTPDLLKGYFQGTVIHKGHKTTTQKYHALKVHADGEYPFDKIDERRPFEDPKNKEYREKIYEPVTRDPMLRVMASLTKIRRSVDWNVKHPLDKYPDSIPERERLHEYDKRLPLTETLENWLFTIGLKNYLLDANAIVLIAPVRSDVSQGEYLKPFPIIYNSDKVLEYKPDELLIVKHVPDVEELENTEKVAGKKPKVSYVVVTTERIQRWELGDNDYTKTYEWKHGLGILPAFKLGGQYFKSLGDALIYESRLSPMLPRLNDACREYSDVQASVVQHLYPQKWVWAADKCPKCVDDNGFPTGFINDPVSKKKVVCTNCGGNLKVASSPFLNMVVRPTNENLGEVAAPLPPAGFLTMPHEIIELQDKRIEKHLYKALASINFQFLDQTPLNESGKAKEVDRDELNNFVYSVAEDLVRIMDLAYKIIIEYRYKIAVKNDDKRRELYPEIRVPEKFDLLSSDYLTEEIERIKKAGVNPVILSTLEAEFAGKKFYSDPMVREMVQCILLLDPMPGISEDDKMLRLSNGGVSRLDYIISSNITQLVRDAISENKDFIQKTREEKLQIVRGLAEKKQAEINALKVPNPDE